MADAISDTVRVTTHHLDGTTETHRYPRSGTPEGEAAIDRFGAGPRPFWDPDTERLAWLRDRRLRVGALLAVAVVLGLLWVLRSPQPGPSRTTPATSGRAAAPTKGPTTTVVSEVTVHVAGAVTRSGIVRLRPGARVIDALDAAGGPRADADLTRINLAAPLADGTQVVVAKVGEPLPNGASASAGAPGAAGGPVNINTATAGELDALPGIGPSRAAAIIAEREAHGPFASVDDLQRVKGLGTARIEELRGRVRT